ncbi:MAG: RNAase P [Nanoarchaeota archaeon]|nr:RNAase P [Nanoarchaeota archaeon]
MIRKNKSQKEKVKEIAEKRIRKLFYLAEENLSSKPLLARRYIFLARQLERKTQTKIPKELKRSFCKKCNLLLKSGKTRIKKGFKVHICECGKVRRIKIS